MQLESLHALFVQEVNLLYQSESRLLEALSSLAEAASDERLRDLLAEHRLETEHQIERLDRVFDRLGRCPEEVKAGAMMGLIQEGEEVIRSSGPPAVRDAALIGAVERVEHYEIAVYGMACALAKQLELHEIAQLLGENLQEEKAADQKLSSLAEGGMFSGGINQEAAAG